MRRKDNVKIYFAVCRPQDLSFYADNFVEKSGAGYSRSCSLPLFFRSSSSSFTRRGFQMKVFDRRIDDRYRLTAETENVLRITKEII